MSHQLLSLSCDAPVESLQDILGNFEGAQVGLRKLRDRLVDSGEQGLVEDASIFLGLYLNYTDELIRRAYLQTAEKTA
ncbi:protein of unknown function [Nitrospira defluvii]|jgi:hypothetical protein|uniref:Uncharacterized protein n=1 Tax=Nitrospira defluvii TaxID=330214 RepID=D8P831_9BACT|nr:protein of unknown function [Nitrospira defluvii]